MYKYANYELFNKRKSEFNCSCLQEGTVSEASILFTNIFIEFAKLCIPNKTIIVREGDKPWYDSELRMNSRKRDRLNKTALKQVTQMTDKNTTCLRIRKIITKHAKQSFYDNLDNIISDLNNDKRKFWKVIRYFVESNSSTSSIPPLCSTLPICNNQWHFNLQIKLIV